MIFVTFMNKTESEYNTNALPLVTHIIILIVKSELNYYNIIFVMNSPIEKTLENSSINSHTNSKVLDSREVCKIFSLLEQSINPKHNSRVMSKKISFKLYINDSINYKGKIKPVNKMKQKLKKILSNKVLKIIL